MFRKKKPARNRRRSDQCAEPDNQLLLEVLMGFLRDAETFPLRPASVKHFPWQQFRDAIQRERLSGHIHYVLLRHPAEAALFPAWLREELAEAYRLTQQRNASFREHLREVCLALQRHELPVIFMRSEVLFSELYPDRGIRPLTDIDVIVALRDIPRVQQVLRELGYEECPGTPVFRRGAIEFDIHGEQASAWRADFWVTDVTINCPDVWKKAVAIDSRQPLIKKLYLYDEIIVSCAHLQEHSYASLIWFLDIRQLIIRNWERFDWPVFLQRANARSLSLPVYLVLAYLQQFSLLSIPREIMKTLAERPWSTVERLSRQRLLKNQRSRLSGELLYTQTLPGFWERWFFLWRLAALTRGSCSLPASGIRRTMALIARWRLLRRNMSRQKRRLRRD